MSVSSGFWIRFARPYPDVFELIGRLSELGWDVNDNGALMYLPVGDDDKFDWTSAPMDMKAELNSIIAAKVRIGELVGIVLTHIGTGHGGTFLFDPAGRVGFSASLERRVVDGRTDVCWYLQMLLPAFESVGLVESWGWDEHR